MAAVCSRKEFLLASGAGVAALAFPGLAAARTGARAAPEVAGVSAFVTEPSLHPPSVTVLTSATPSPGFLFVSSLNGPGKRGPLILDNRGRVVWFRQVDTVAIDFRRQVYEGKQVLTWWEGTISNIGVGEGECVILDQSYETVARVRAGNGLKADVHEFLLTPRGTALITIYNAVTADLTAFGGSPSGVVLDSIVQEVDVRTGAVVFEWHSLDHVPLTDSFAMTLEPFDYFHINSVGVDLDGNLLISARNTSAVYKVDRQTGRVLWTLGGKSSDFTLGPGAAFAFQHDARGHTNGTITLFDNGPSPSSPTSRAIRLGLDLADRRAYLIQQYQHPTGIAAPAMGNAQVLDGDSVLVGWGTAPYVTEFGPAGDVRFDAKFDGNAWNYRAFRSPWVGRPRQKPKVVARRQGNGVAVFASWHGSTETRYWRIATGDARDALTRVRTVAATGLETTARIPGRPRFASATALDALRRPLAASNVVAVRAR